VTVVATGCGTALCAGTATWLVVDRHPLPRRARALFPHGSRTQAPWALAAGATAALRTRGLRPGAQYWCLLPAVALALLGRSLLPLFVAAAAVPLVRRGLRSREQRREGEERADSAVALCGAIASELRAGLQPGQALLAAAGTTGGLGVSETAVAAALRFGGDVPEALRAAARAPGAGGLVGLAVCWQVAVDGGAGLAAGLDRLEAALRAEQDQREGLRAQLAGAWSTVVLLAVLPVVGLGLGWCMGTDPLKVLLHTAAGWLCLLTGGLLEAAGLWWARRIVRAGEAP
jgi:tight adherence protein B